MNAPIAHNRRRQARLQQCPEYLTSLMSTTLLPGESEQDFETVRQLIISEITPRSGIEWLWAIDLIHLSWDIVRYRALRQQVLRSNREMAIENALNRVDLAGIPSNREAAREHSKRNAALWRESNQAAAEIDAHLKSKGIDAATINLDVFAILHELYLILDAMLISTQNRRVTLLKEYNARQIPRLR